MLPYNVGTHLLCNPHDVTGQEDHFRHFIRREKLNSHIIIFVSFVGGPAVVESSADLHLTNTDSSTFTTTFHTEGHFLHSREATPYSGKP
jgi:hypothetical protein